MKDKEFATITRSPRGGRPRKDPRTTHRNGCGLRVNIYLSEDEVEENLNRLGLDPERYRLDPDFHAAAARRVRKLVRAGRGNEASTAKAKMKLAAIQELDKSINRVSSLFNQIARRLNAGEPLRNAVLLELTKGIEALQDIRDMTLESLENDV